MDRVGVEFLKDRVELTADILVSDIVFEIFELGVFGVFSFVRVFFNWKVLLGWVMFIVFFFFELDLLKLVFELLYLLVLFVD